MRTASAGLALCLMLAACTGLPARSFVAPTDQDRSYDGFIVYAAFRDLAVADAFEQGLCRRLEQNSHACEGMRSAAPPTQPQDSASRQRAMRQSGAEAALVIELADPDTTSRRILANGQPGYRVSLIDIQRQAIVGRMTVEGRLGRRALKSRARDVATAVVDRLRQEHWLTPRR